MSLGSEAHPKTFLSPVVPEKPRTITDIEMNTTTVGAHVQTTNQDGNFQTEQPSHGHDGRSCGEMTLFQSECEANHSWFNHKMVASSMTSVRAGSTGFEKRSIVIQKNKKLVLFNRVEGAAGPLDHNASEFAFDDYKRRHKVKFVRNQKSYGFIEQYNVDKNCTVESVIELGLLAAARINKTVM